MLIFTWTLSVQVLSIKIITIFLPKHNYDSVFNLSFLDILALITLWNCACRAGFLDVNIVMLDVGIGLEINVLTSKFILLGYQMLGEMGCQPEICFYSFEISLHLSMVILFIQCFIDSTE